MKKLILLLVAAGIYTICFASNQILKLYWTKIQLSIPHQDSLNKLFAAKLNLSEQNKQAKFSHTLANGDKVYLFPQDT